MLKALLYLIVSLISFCSRAQSPAIDVTGSAETATEDSAQAVSEVTLSLTGSEGLQLAWRVSGRMPGFFTIERSDNGKSFEVVTVLNNLGVRSQYQWIDEAPKKGKSFYRIRYAFEEGKLLYSKTVSYVIAGYTSFKFYPNPVDHILIIRSDAPADVQIIDGNGKTRITESKLSGLHTINVSSLEKGIYLIRFSNKLTNVISQEKLIKN